MIVLPWCQSAEDAAVDRDGLRRDVAGAVGQQETNQLRQLIRRPDATLRHVVAAPLAPNGLLGADARPFVFGDFLALSDWPDGE